MFLFQKKKKKLSAYDAETWGGRLSSPPSVAIIVFGGSSSVKQAINVGVKNPSALSLQKWQENIQAYNVLCIMEYSGFWFL